jgi:hypothetical protein
VPTAVAPTVLAPTALAPAATVDDPALAASPEPHERTAREAAWAGTKPKLDLPARPSRRASILAAAAAVAAVLAVGAWLASSRARDTAGAGPPSMAPAPSSADVRTAVVPSAESTDLGPPGPSAASSASAPRPRAPRPVAHVASAAAPASASAAPSASAPAAVTSAAPPTNALVQPLPKTPLK